MTKVDLAHKRLLRAHGKYLRAVPCDQRFYIGFLAGLVEAFAITLALAPSQIISWIPGLKEAFAEEGVR